LKIIMFKHLKRTSLLPRVYFLKVDIKLYYVMKTSKYFIYD